MVEPVDFSIAGGGLLERLAQRFRSADRMLVRVLAALIITWLPLLVLSFADGVAIENVGIPFLEDYGAYGRLLVALPVLILAEIPIGRRTRQVLREFITSRFVCERDIPLFNNAAIRAARLKESVVPEIIIFGMIFAVAAYRLPIVLSDPLTTWYRQNGSITSVGWYYVLVSLPIFQFLLIRWLWRLIIWADLLWKISRLNLQLLPIHPDKMGGLAFLGLAQIPFCLIGFAGGAITSSNLANNIIYRGASLDASLAPMVEYVVLAVVIVLAPILVFTGKLVELRADGIFKYGDLGEEYARLFDQKWVQGMHPDDETILGSSDIQSLADLRNSFDIVQNMNIVAIDRKTIGVIAATAAVPMIPLFFLALPFQEIIARILGMLS